jgi:hypothetical protein
MILNSNFFLCIKTDPLVAREDLLCELMIIKSWLKLNGKFLLKKRTKVRFY